jgi:integrase
MSRIQRGSLRLRTRATQAPFWEFRFRANDGGVRKLRAVRLGTVEELPTKIVAWAKARKFVPDEENLHAQTKALVGDLIDRFALEENLQKIVAGRYLGSAGLKYSTAYAYLHILNRYIRPRWGEERVVKVRPAAIQEWLGALPGAPRSKAKIKAVLHRLFERAMLWGELDVQRNPVSLTEIRGTTRGTRSPMVLTAEQFQAILERLPQPHRTMVLVAQCLGLRVSEIVGLQWPDFDFERMAVSITRSVVRGRVGEVKTEYSRDELPLGPALVAALSEWRDLAPVSREHWVFANRQTLQPYEPNTLQKKWLSKIGRAIGLAQPLGWHTFRHTYRTWLDATGAPVGVQQKLMRHAQVSTTMNVYGNALMQSKREANRKVVHLAFVKQPTENSQKVP